MSCAVGLRCGSCLALLWLWCRPAAAALIRSLVWELPHVAGVVLKKRKKNLNMLYTFITKYTDQYCNHCNIVSFSLFFKMCLKHLRKAYITLVVSVE